jgi:cell wall-associated NlpC family hydrolase
MPFLPQTQQIIQTVTDLDTQLQAQTARADQLELIRQQHDAQIQALTAAQQTPSMSKYDIVLTSAKALDALGVPYKFGGNSISGMDCSAFTQFNFKQAGIVLPRVSRDQATVGSPVSATDHTQWKPGDLLFYDYSGEGVIDHVGMYIGNGLMIHTNTPATGINIKATGTPKIVRRVL